MPTNSRLAGLRDLSVADRRAAAAAAAGLDADVLTALTPQHGLSLDLADRMIENVIGLLALPVGVATNFTVNGRDYLVPMATEEASVVAAASNAAKLARTNGGFVTSSSAPLMQAQVQVIGVADPEAAKLRLFEERNALIELANAQDPQLVGFGGGVKDLVVRVVESSQGRYVVMHLVVDVRDAMGANAVNTMAEAVASRVGEIAKGRTLLRILTNKADLRLCRARATWSAVDLGGAGVVQDILHAAALAEADPYRAATHNKGILNGITAVVLATGNDTRAVEAGCHSHAVARGRYTSLSHFEKDGAGDLTAVLEVPMPVGLVGGATKVHPVARAAVRLLGVTSAAELGEVITAVGLAQNFAAVRALATEGIQRGHMALHARNVAATAGARTPQEVDAVAQRLVADRKIRAEYAEQILAEIRQDLSGD